MSTPAIIDLTASPAPAFFGPAQMVDLTGPSPNRLFPETPTIERILADETTLPSLPSPGLYLEEFAATEVVSPQTNRNLAFEMENENMVCCGSELYGCGRLLEQDGHQYTENLIFNEFSYCFKCWKDRKEWIKFPDSLTEEAKRNDGIVAHHYRKRNIVKC